MKMASITIGEYLLKRLKELNIETIFGVPGDYNLPLLDLIEEDKDITWGNNTNELNAAYAADGYARIRGAGALVTTFGVGELSAINGVAGSFSEMLPVIHVVGTPITSSQLHKTLLHHSLGNGDFKVFAKMSSMITVASACLTHEKALEQIDHVIRTSFVRKQPGYIAIPLDLMKKQVELSEPFMDALQLAPPTSPPEIMQIALEKILELVKNATYPAIVVDGCILRHHLQKEANAFVIKSGFLTFAAPMGKGAIDESLPNFRGCYSGNVSLESIKREIEQADLLIELGSIKSDFNTGNFSYGLEKAKTIALHSFGTTVYYAEYPGVSMMDLLPLLTSRLPEKSCQLSFGPRGIVLPIDDSMQEITHNYLWNKVSEYIEPNSIVLGETGTAEFGLFNMKSTPNTTYISQ
ncbi:Pyruvate decarboxylase 1, partial [Rhizopus stolonifer]